MKRIAALALALIGCATFASAYHLTAEDVERIPVLANELALATEQLYNNAEVNRHHFQAREERALMRLAQLDSEARDLRRRVRMRPDDVEGARDAFDEVVAAYTRASSALDDLHSYPTVIHDFHAVENVVSQLTDLFGGQEHYWGRHEREHRSNLTIPAGTIVPVALRAGLRARDMRSGEEFVASLGQDLAVRGRVIAPRGSDVLLRVVDLERAGRRSGRERISIELGGLRIGGRMQSVESNTFTFQAESNRGSDLEKIIGGAAIGAVIGAIAGDGSGAAKGAAIGGAAGTAVVLTTRGKAVRLPAGYRLDFALRGAVRVVLPGGRNPERAPYVAPGDISRR